MIWTNWFGLSSFKRHLQFAFRLIARQQWVFPSVTKTPAGIYRQGLLVQDVSSSIYQQHSFTETKRELGTQAGDVAYRGEGYITDVTVQLIHFWKWRLNGFTRTSERKSLDGFSTDTAKRKTKKLLWGMLLLWAFESVRTLPSVRRDWECGEQVQSEDVSVNKSSSQLLPAAAETVWTTGGFVHSSQPSEWADQQWDCVWRWTSGAFRYDIWSMNHIPSVNSKSSRQEMMWMKNKTKKQLPGSLILLSNALGHNAVTNHQF